MSKTLTLLNAILIALYVFFSISKSNTVSLVHLLIISLPSILAYFSVTIGISRTLQVFAFLTNGALVFGAFSAFLGFVVKALDDSGKSGSYIIDIVAAILYLTVGILNCKVIWAHPKASIK